MYKNLEKIRETIKLPSSTKSRSALIALVTRTERMHPYAALYISEQKEQRLWRLPVLVAERARQRLGEGYFTAHGTFVGRPPLTV